MNKALFGLGLTLVLNLNTAAQTHKKSPEPGDVDGPQKRNQVNWRSKSSKSDPTSARKPSLPDVTNIQAVLERSLDTRRSRIGDEVVLTTSQAVKHDGVVIIPKGANLIGRVTEVIPFSKKGSPSRLGLLFDRLDADEISAPISATIVSITSARTPVQAADLLASDVDRSSHSTASVAGGTSGGGLLGGLGSSGKGVITQVANTAGSVSNSVAQTVGDLAINAQNIGQGIQISNVVRASAAGSATLSSQQTNVHLEKGLIFQVRLTNRPDNQE